MRIAFFFDKQLIPFAAEHGIPGIPEMVEAVKAAMEVRKEIERVEYANAEVW